MCVCERESVPRASERDCNEQASVSRCGTSSPDEKMDEAPGKAHAAQRQLAPIVTDSERKSVSDRPVLSRLVVVVVVVSGVHLSVCANRHALASTSTSTALAESEAPVCATGLHSECSSARVLERVAAS